MLRTDDGTLVGVKLGLGTFVLVLRLYVETMSRLYLHYGIQGELSSLSHYEMYSIKWLEVRIIFYS